MIALFENISTWKLLVDLALMGSLLVLCFRFLKTPTSFRVSKKIGELEGTLKSLIKEAENSGKGLNEQLLSRHSELKKLLYELDSVEHRLQKSIAATEEKRTEPIPAEVRPERREHSFTAATTPPQPTTPSLEYIFEPVETPPPPSFHEAVGIPKPQPRQEAFPRQAEHVQAQIAPQRISPEQSRFSRAATQSPEPQRLPPQNSSTPAVKPAPPQRRLVPEQIRQETPAQPQPQTPRESRVPQREIHAPQYESDVANVYSAAEQLLKAGTDLQTVSQQTRLPMEQVKLLSQLVGQNKSTDPEQRRFS